MFDQLASIPLTYIAAPFLCAGIGWFTNYLAIKMLFHPREPKRFFGLTFHGIFPKRKSALAENLGVMIEEQLISHDDIQKVMHDPAFLQLFHDLASDHVNRFITEKLPQLSPMVAMFLNDAMKDKIRDVLNQEIEDLLPELLTKATSALEEKMNIKTMIREKVESYPMEKIEDMLFGIMKKEFRFIELVGAVLGFVIGVLQAVLFYFAT